MCKSEKNNIINVLEGKLVESGLLDILLLDRTRITTNNPITLDLVSKRRRDDDTKYHIIWATDTYDKKNPLSPMYNSEDLNKIVPRCVRAKEEQLRRTKDKAEVFTPSWIVNKMINSIDEKEYGIIFNTETDKGWKDSIIDFTNAKIGWQEYLDEIRLEICTGEGVFIVSRYDATTGEYIEPNNRVGILDRKLRVVNHYAPDENNWLIMVEKAFRTTYGYEFQGDSLLLARENLLYTLFDFYKVKFGYDLDIDSHRQFVERIAEIISWNIWQMDGLTGCIPMSCPDTCGGCKQGLVLPDSISQGGLFSFNLHKGINAKIMDWSKNSPIDFISLFMKKGSEDRMKVGIIVGNPPYQKDTNGTLPVNIWPDFINSAVKLSEKVSLIHPAKWVSIDKSLMKKIKENLIKSGLKFFDYYDSSKECFNINLDGGISICNFEKDFKDKIKYSVNGKFKGIYDKDKIILSNEFEEEIFEKLNLSKFNNKSMIQYIDNTFGFDHERKDKLVKCLKEDKTGMKDPIYIWANRNYGRGSSYEWLYVERNDISDIKDKLIKDRNIKIDKNGNSIKINNGANGYNNNPDILKTNEIAVNSYIITPKNNTDKELKLVQSLLLTKTIRFLMSIKQKSQQVEGFELIPDYLELLNIDNTITEFTDSWFYKTFDFSKQLQDTIENSVAEKKLS